MNTPTTPAAHHDALIAEMFYELAAHGPQSLIDMVATMIAGLPDRRASELSADLERFAYGVPAGLFQLCDCGATGCLHCDEAMQAESPEDCAPDCASRVPFGSCTCGRVDAATNTDTP